MDGVRDVNVSLKEGLATISFAPSNRVRIAQIWKAIRENGFTPRAAEIRAAGVLSARGDTLVLSVIGSEDSLVLEEAQGATMQLAQLRVLGTGSRVVIIGQLPEPADKDDPPHMLLVRSFLR